MTAINTAAFGLQASLMRLNASASNVANINAVGPVTPAPSADNRRNATDTPAYQPLVVRQSATADGGVSATYTARQPASVVRYDPSSAAADAEGLVAAPNVSETDEAVEQVMAAEAFKANVAVIRTAGAMQRDAIDRLG